MEASPIKTLISLSNSVRALLEIVSTEIVVNFRKPRLDVLLLKKLKKTLLDLQDLLLYYWRDTFISNPTLYQSLDLLRSAVFQASSFFEGIIDFSWYDIDNLIINKQLKNLAPLNYFDDVINSRKLKLSQILQALHSGEQRVVSNSIIVSHETPPTSSIYGRDADIQKLKHLLLSTDGDNKIRIISIVGMGGIGKTTLAKHLYNHPQVNENFELKLWADFSNDVDDFSVFENILQSITSQTTINGVYPSFLLVLDGVWDARFVNWTLLMDILNAGDTGSRIIVTTRDERVAMSVHPFCQY